MLLGLNSLLLCQETLHLMTNSIFFLRLVVVQTCFVHNFSQRRLKPEKNRIIYPIAQNCEITASLKNEPQRNATTAIRICINATGNADNDVIFPYVAPKINANGKSIKLFKKSWLLSLSTAKIIGPLICKPPMPKNNVASINALCVSFSWLKKRRIIQKNYQPFSKISIRDILPVH